MKICFVSYEYSPFVIGGACVYAEHITRELAKLGHEVHVISPNIKYQETHFFENDVLVHRIPVMHKRFLRSPSFWLNLARKYNEIRKAACGFDIVHGNGVSDFSLSGWQVKVARVVTVHHLTYLVAQNVTPLQRLRDLSGETSHIASLIERSVISRANRVIAVSNFTRDSLVSIYNVVASKIEVVPNGIDLADYVFHEQEIMEFRRVVGLGNTITFLFVGRLLDPRKNLPLLLRAFKIVRENAKSVKLLLVGSGNELKVKELARSLGINGDVILLGNVDDILLRKCYAACDVLISSSSLEGFSLVILEAMAAGKPVIALNRGAVSELVRDGVNGLLVNKENPQELAAAMAFFVDHLDAFTAMGRVNKEVSKNFSWERSAKRTERVYQSILSQA